MLFPPLLVHSCEHLMASFEHSSMGQYLGFSATAAGLTGFAYLLMLRLIFPFSQNLI